MVGANGSTTLVNQYALVSYIPDPLGLFLDRLRLDLVPGCSPHAHVTILPPRPISAPELDASREILEVATKFPGFEVELGDVEIFPLSKVVYIGLKRGEDELREIYAALNHGAVSFHEPFPYHPHVTLAQNFPLENLTRIAELAQQRWASFPHSKRFMVESLDFVKNLYGNRWSDLASIQLKNMSVAS